METLRPHIRDHNEFEQLVFKILSHTDAIKIDWRRGGRDRAKDLILHYQHHQSEIRVSVECKFYSSSISLRDLSNTLDWAKIDQPDLVYLWACPYITPDTKDYLLEFTRIYGIPVEYEEEANIIEYYSDLQVNLFHRIKGIRDKIFIAAGHQRDTIETLSEYKTYILPSDHFLVDREEEWNELSNNQVRYFYIHGLMGTGKTQLAKNFAIFHYRHHRSVFWHAFLFEHDIEAQEKTFFSLFASFLSSEAACTSFSKHISEYGLSDVLHLAEVTISAFFSSPPIIFFDDFHRCKSEKIFIFLEKVMQKSCVNIVFIAWYNVLPAALNKKINIKFIHLTGLDSASLITLIEYVTGAPASTEVIDCLLVRFQGIPYFATLANELKRLLEDNTFVFDSQNLLLCILSELSEREVLIVQALGISRSPISLSTWRIFDLEFAIYTLTHKRIISITGRSCRIHDTLKQFIRLHYQDGGIQPDVFKILEQEAKRNPSTKIDIIEFLIANRDFKRATDVLTQGFGELLDQGLDITLLELIDRLINNIDNIADLVYKKATILERSGHYKIASGLVEMISLGNESNLSRDSGFIYTRARLMYFENNFDEMLIFLEKTIIFPTCSVVSDSNLLQCLFLYGRTFHVRGDLELAVSTYLWIIRAALKIGAKPLLVKALHRIAMAEEVLGFIDEARLCFEKLINTQVTLKRRSFLLYRLAKCVLRQDNLKQAYELNEESIKIKTGFGHKRGLVFSWKLKAKIFFIQEELHNALLWAGKAYDLATSLGLQKEVVSVGLLLVHILRSLGRMTQGKKVLDAICSIACSLRLSFRIQQIRELYEHVGCKKTCGKDLTDELSSRDREVRLMSIQSHLSTKDRLQVKELMAGKEAITPELCNFLPV